MKGRNVRARVIHQKVKVNVTLTSKGQGQCMCTAFYSGGPEHSTVSPEARVVLPAMFQRTSLSPRILTLNLSISLAIWAALTVSYIVRTFHVAIRIAVLGERSFVGRFLHAICSPPGRFRRSVRFVGVIVKVSVAEAFFHMARVLTLCTTLLLLHLGLGPAMVELHL